LYDAIGWILMMWTCCYVWHHIKTGEGLPIDYRKGNSYENWK